MLQRLQTKLIRVIKQSANNFFERTMSGMYYLY